jgi:dipeptidyl aminopeptidase/acylaminoacyl peptidase
VLKEDVMKTIKVLMSLLFLSSLFISTKSEAEPYPLEYFALRDVMSNVTLSPDGKTLALMTNPTKKGNPILEIYDASDLTKEPFRVGGEKMEIVGYNWVSNTNLVLNFRQKVRDEIDGFNQGVFESKLAKLDIIKKKIKELKETNARVVHVLPKKKEKVILAFSPGGRLKSDVDPRFRPLSYYEFDLKSGHKKLLLRGQIPLGRVRFDIDGNPVFATGFDRRTYESVWYVRPAGTDDWQEIFRLSEDSFESFNVEGFDIKPDTILVTAHNGKNTQGLWEFNYKTKKFGDPIYQRNDRDVAGVARHSNRWTNLGDIAGVAYYKDRVIVEYFDQNEGAIHAQLRGLIPNAHDVRINSRAINGQDMVVYNTGPRDPGSYYLLKSGKLTKVGSKQPLLEAEKLSDVKYITYKARDGKKIRAYVTIPNGEGPYPTIVMPHGGPFVQEYVSYDEWSQMLANNGYLVIQPSYRGSQGYGLEFYQSAFINGGKGGYQMQDDKDDGVAYLIKEGLTDPNRVAMFGWSYGGYAALIAAARKEQIYQCVIAGAAVADNRMQVNYYKDRMRGASEVEQLNFWQDSISPIEQAKDVNIPLLLIHGSVDQRVPPEHQKRYRDELDKYKKNYKFVELDGADHFSNTLYYDHQLKLYESMIDYLKSDCGDEGL